MIVELVFYSTLHRTEYDATPHEKSLLSFALKQTQIQVHFHYFNWYVIQ